MFTTLRRLLTKGQRKPSPRNRNYFRPRLEALEERYAPAGLTYTWIGNAAGLWSVAANWQGGPVGTVPGNTDTALFDHNVADAACTFDEGAGYKVGLMAFQNGFTSQLTINPGLTLETAGGFVLNSKNPQDKAKISFGSVTSKLQADAGGSAIYNFQFLGQRGQVYIASGATLNVASNLDSDTNSDFVIGGSMTLASSAVDTFHGGAGIIICCGGGSMLIQAMNAVVLSDSGDGGIIENWGSFAYIGAAVGNTMTTVGMAFLNHSNATLDRGTIEFARSSATTNGYSVKMDGGSLILNHAVDVKLSNGYYQTGGTLSSDDAQMDLLVAQRKVELDGGVVNMIVPGAAPFATLSINGGDLNFNGAEYDARINGAGGGAFQADEINVTGNINIAGNSKLVVTALNRNPPVIDQVWDILASANRIINGRFASTSFPQGVVGPMGTPLGNGIYELSSWVS